MTNSNQQIADEELEAQIYAKSFDRYDSPTMHSVSIRLNDLKQIIYSRDKLVISQARNPLEKILDEQGWNKCDECKDYLPTDDECLCESCDAMFHESCAGYIYDGEGEYPSESAYAVCKKCVTEHPKEDM